MATRNLSKIKRERLIEKIRELKETASEEMVAVLNEVETELNKKKYGLIWEEHEEAVDVQMRDNIPVFTEVTEREITANPDGDYNFLLEGDNLHSLKLLEKTHKGKIDLIYIDPPYNRGNKDKDDFIYNDTYIDKNDAFRHSKWASYISVRLNLAYKLLSEKGLIFISIDDNEINSLRFLCDEIFGEENRIATLIWKKRYQGAKEKQIVICHEYLLMYAKDRSLIPPLFVSSDAEYAKRYFKHSDEFGAYRTQPLEAGNSMDDRENLRFPIMAPDGSEVLPKRQWIWSKEHVEKAIQSHQIGFSKTKQGKWSVYIKQYLNDEKGVQRKTKQFSIIDGIYTQHGTKEIEDIFLDGGVFNFPKPTNLILKILDLVPFTEDYIVLDFFAGSGTTGDAVLKKNFEDGRNRKFILCTNNENKICENVTYPRVKTVITGERIDGSKYSDGIPANLKYYKTEFVPKTNDGSVPYVLLEHVKELIQLELHCKIDNKTICIAFSEDELDSILADNAETCKKLFLSSDVLLSGKQIQQIEKHNIEVIDIPEYYFSEELREVDEV